MPPLPGRQSRSIMALDSKPRQSKSAKHEADSEHLQPMTPAFRREILPLCILIPASGELAAALSQMPAVQPVHSIMLGC